ncbi:MAG: T9SS type A sorting domain-containing protein [Saprospiraceae bacterium]|nr:T9SS type A sorting domain-containing protein [Saprospiraceae bacterium]
MKIICSFLLSIYIFSGLQSQDTFIKLLDISGTDEGAYQIVPYRGNFLVSYAHIDNSYTRLYSGILEMDKNANVIKDRRFVDFSNNRNAIVVDSVGNKLFYTGEEYTLTNIPQSFRIYELDPISLDSLSMVEVIDSNRIYPIIYQTNAAILGDQLVVVGSGTLDNKTNIMTAYLNKKTLKLDTITHIGEGFGSIATRYLYIDRRGYIVHLAKFFNFGDTSVLIHVDINKQIVESIKLKDTKCYGIWPFGCQLSDGRTIYQRCGIDLPEIVFLADSTFEIVNKFEWVKNLPAQSPYPSRHGRNVYKLIEARNGDIIGVGKFKWFDAPTPNILSDAPFIFRINNQGKLLWHKALYNTSDISSYTIGFLSGVTELEDGSIMAVGELRGDIDFDTVLGRPKHQPDILIVRISADGCIEGYDCKDVLYKVPSVTSLTTNTKDVTQPDIKKYSALVYPNPSSGILSVQLDETYSKVIIGIYDLQGNFLSKYYNLSTDKVELNLSFLPAATYIYKIFDGHRQISSGQWVKL